MKCILITRRITGTSLGVILFLAFALIAVNVIVNSIIDTLTTNIVIIKFVHVCSTNNTAILIILFGSSNWN